MDKRPIEDIFNECCEKMMAGTPAEEIIRQYPNYANELQELLGLTQSIKNTQPLKVTDQQMISCLIKVGEEIQRQKESSFLAGLSRLFLFPSVAWARGIALSLVIAFAAWGTVNASAGSVPGDPLYLVKLLTEKATYFLTFNPEGQMELKITFSERRSRELVKEFNENGVINIQTLKAMLNESGQSLDAVVKLPVKEQKVYFAQLNNLSNYQKDVLQDLRGKASEAQRPTLDRAISLCQQRCEWLKKVCDKACITTTPGCPCPLGSKKMS